MFNPYGISHYYQLEPILGVMGGIFLFFPNFNRRFCKQTEVPDQTPHNALPMSHKRTGIYGLRFTGSGRNTHLASLVTHIHKIIYF